MNEENTKLNLEILQLQEELDLATRALSKIEQTLEPAITINIKKTQRTTAPSVIKAHRESLLVLREIQRELIDWHNKTFKNTRK